MRHDWRRHPENVPTNTAVIANALENTDTPFGAVRMADQRVQFAADPSLGLTRERVAWYSNTKQFDNTHFSEPSGEIRIQTSATGTDTARFRSAFAGQYTSHGLSVPGLEIRIADTTVGSDGTVSMDHGQVRFGVFFWDEANTQVETGFGVVIDTDSAKAFWISDGSSKGESPVAQSDWNLDTLDGSDTEAVNPSGIQWDPSEGWIWNGPYWWYNAGQLLIGFVDADEERFVPAHKFVPREDAPGAPNLATPNLPTQVRVDNDGDANQVTVGVGGMQYTTFGVPGVKSTRETNVVRQDVSVNTEGTGDPIDPTTTTGDYLLAVKRNAGFRDLEVGNSKPTFDSDQDIYLYLWTEFDDEAALTDANFTDPNVVNAGNETRVQLDTNATDYTPTEAVLEGITKIEGGQGASNAAVRPEGIERRLELNGTRVFTATNDGNNANLDIVLGIQEGY